MPKTLYQGKEIQKWLVNNVEIKEAYYNGKKIFSNVTPNAVTVTLSSTNHNFDYNTDLNPQVLAGLGSWDNKTDVEIVVKSGVQLVSKNGKDCIFKFNGGWAGRNVKVIIEPGAYVIGRGANADNSGNTVNGKYAVINENNSVVLNIDNKGTLRGGGYASATGGTYQPNRPPYEFAAGGAGGAPFGLGYQPTNSGLARPGGNATFDIPGIGGVAGPVSSKNGGEWTTNAVQGAATYLNA